MADVFDQAVPSSKTAPKQKVAVQATKGGDVFDQAAVSAPSSAPQSDDSSDQFAQDRAVTEAWAQGHPFWGPIFRFAVSGGQNAANAITGIPGATYRAMTDPPAPEESGLPYQQRVIARLLGAKQAAQAAGEYAAGKVRPIGAASVLPEALGTGLGQVSGGAVYGKGGDVVGDIASGVPISRIVKAGGAAAKAGAGKFPLVGPPTKAAILAATKSWRGSAPVEQVNPALVSPSRTLPGMNPPEVTGRPTPGPIQGPSRGLMLPGETEPPMIPASKVSTTPPKSSPISKLDQLRSIARNIPESAPETAGPQLRIAGQDVPANADLTPGLQVPQSRVEGKIMQVLRKEGTGMSIGKDRLMDAPQLRGISPDLVQKAVVNLNKQGKIWHEETGGGAHEPSYTVALKKR